MPYGRLGHNSSNPLPYLELLGEPQMGLPRPCPSEETTISD